MTLEPVTTFPRTSEQERKESELLAATPLLPRDPTYDARPFELLTLDPPKSFFNHTTPRGRARRN